MKKIIESNSPCKTIGLNTIKSDGRNIIAYKTSGPTGTAILRWCEDIDVYGFVYLRDLLRGEPYPRACYNGPTSQQAIMNVIRDGKEVYYFNDQYDFLAFAYNPDMY